MTYTDGWKSSSTEETVSAATYDYALAVGYRSIKTMNSTYSPDCTHRDEFQKEAIAGTESSRTICTVGNDGGLHERFVYTFTSCSRLVTDGILRCDPCDPRRSTQVREHCPNKDNAGVCHAMHYSSLIEGVKFYNYLLSKIILQNVHCTLLCLAIVIRITFNDNDEELGYPGAMN